MEIDEITFVRTQDIGPTSIGPVVLGIGMEEIQSTKIVTQEQALLIAQTFGRVLQIAVPQSKGAA